MTSDFVRSNVASQWCWRDLSGSSEIGVDLNELSTKRSKCSVESNMVDSLLTESYTLVLMACKVSCRTWKGEAGQIKLTLPSTFTYSGKVVQGMPNLQ